MLRDLFFYMNENIQSDMQFTGGWQIFVLVLFLLSLIGVCFILIKTKKAKKKLSKLGWLGIIISLLFMYQIVPVTFDWIAFKADSYENFQKFNNLAIKTSVINWQKGLYYSHFGHMLASIDFTDRKKLYKKEVMEAYDKAYSYIKSYKYGIIAFDYEYYNEWDKAANVYLSADQPIYFFAARDYIFNKDYNNAMICIDKLIANPPNNGKGLPSIYAIKAYLEKELGNLSGAEEHYQKALDLKNEIYTKEKIYAIYDNAYEYYKNEIERSYGYEKFIGN